MPYVRIWVHLVWTTYNREPYLSKDIRRKLFIHIKENAKAKGIYLDFINGYLEHIHCLISMNAEQNISKIAHLLKGESSYWINKNQLTKSKFYWQDDYYVKSVSNAEINHVREYIKNQEEHHRTKTFQEEYDEFIKGIDLLNEK
jgi:putative transposase